MARSTAVLAPGAPGVRDPLRRALRGRGTVNVPRDIHRLPTGARASEGPAPVDSPWISLCATLRPQPSGSLRRLGALGQCRTATVATYRRDHWTRPKRPKHGIPDTPAVHGHSPSTTKRSPNRIANSGPSRAAPRTPSAQSSSNLAERQRGAMGAQLPATVTKASVFRKNIAAFPAQNAIVVDATLDRVPSHWG